MELEAKAGDLARALGLAALPLDDSRVRKIEALGAVRLEAHANESRIAVRSNILDLSIDAIVVGGEIEAPGEIAVPGARLAALVAAVPAGQMVTIAGTDSAATVTAGRSRYRLPILPLDQLPEPLQPGEPIGEIEINRDDALRLFARPLFAASTETTRFYLNGVFLQTAGGTLTAVATDGHRLCRITMPAGGNLSDDRRGIIPLTSAKIIIKILKAAKPDSTVMLRRTPTLFELHAGGVTFISKLIDAEYPAFEAVVPPVAGNNVIVNRAELARAITRLAAVADAEQKTRVAHVSWGAGENGLHLAIANDVGEDVIEAELTGAGKTAAQIPHLAELLDELEGERVSFNVNTHGDAILVRDPDDAGLAVLQMPCRF
jgi:DNA polymerase III subunit beta